MTVDGIIAEIGPRPSLPELSAPSHQFVENDIRLGLAVEDMARHTSNEGHELFLGLQSAGYRLRGFNLEDGDVDVRRIVNALNPGTVVLQDKREWHTRSFRDFREKRSEFQNVTALKDHPSFKLTILKDAQHSPEYHRDSAEEIGCHAWITYYHPRIVKHLAPYVRPGHCVRTYHSVNAAVVPAFSNRRLGCLLSGAVSGAYPLRSRLAAGYRDLPETDYLGHPGYHNRGTQTPKFLETLSRYKVAICTASKYGYALRKIMEATACGCRVITDLPSDDKLPGIDDNLIRVRSEWSVEHIAAIIRETLADYDPARQEYMAAKAKSVYDYRNQGRILAEHIEDLRRTYASS